MKMSKRSYQPEWLDLGLPYYTKQEYADCMNQLDKVGRLLGGDKATLSIFRKKKLAPDSILDVGCGGGQFSLKLAQNFPNAQVLGIDINSQAIEIAKTHLRLTQPHLTNMTFKVPPSPQLNYPDRSFDVIVATLVCHHLNDEELIDFLKNSYRVARKAVIINDLHRNFLATTGFGLIAPFLFRNRIVFHDGLLSIKRAFTKADWVTYLTAAGIPPEKYRITWHWAFRWIVFIDTSHHSVESNHA